MSRDELPRGVFPKGRRYYLVDAKGWADRDAMAKLLASPPSAQPAEKL